MNCELMVGLNLYYNLRHRTKIAKKEITKDQITWIMKIGGNAIKPFWKSIPWIKTGAP